MKQIVLISVFFLLLSGCAVERGSYSYSYYTGIKNPRVQHNTTDAANSDERTSSTPDRVEREEKPPPEYHRVSKGETLYSIAWEYGLDVKEVAAWNAIRAPYLIYPNQLVRTQPPRSTERSVSKPAPYKTRKYTRPSPSRSKSTARSKTQTRYSTSDNGKISWQWPTKGNIISKYSARDAGKKGLDIAGRQGQAIYAAASGEIVYSGSGLRGYGKLIIIKHNETYLSAYSNNAQLHVKEDQKVKKGQHIADMGSSGADAPMLHFEVRRNGKPVDPLGYLPARR